MSLYPAPTAQVPVFNPALFTDVNGGISYGSVGTGSFLNYPQAQGAESWTNGTSTTTLDSGSIALSVINGTLLQGVGLNGDGFAYNNGSIISTTTWENLQTKVQAVGALSSAFNSSTINVNNTIAVQNGETTGPPTNFITLSSAEYQRMMISPDGTLNASYFGNPGNVLTSGGENGNIYWGSGGGGSVGNLQDVLNNGNTATTGITLTDGFTTSKIKLQNESGAYSELASGGMYCQNFDATDNFQLTAQALLFKNSAIGVSATNASTLDISTPILTFSQLGGDPTNVLTLDADYNAVWSPSAGGAVGLQDVFNTSASATVVGDTPSSPNYNPLGMTINTDAGALHLGSNIIEIGNPPGEIRTFPTLFIGTYTTDDTGSNIGVGQYTFVQQGQWELNATDDTTGVIDKSFFCNFKNGFNYIQPTTDVQATQLKLNLKLTDTNGNETTYDQNSATITSNNIDSTSGNSINLDATTPQTYILNNDGIGNQLTSVSNAHSTTFNFLDTNTDNYEKFKVDSGTTKTSKTEMILKNDFATGYGPYNALSVVDIYTGDSTEYIGKNPTGITVFTSTLDVVNQSELKTVIETDDNFHLETSVITGYYGATPSRDNPVGANTYVLLQNRQNDANGGIVQVESQLTNTGFATYTSNNADPTNPDALFNTFKIETNQGTNKTFLGAEDQSGNYFQFTDNNRFELTAPNFDVDGNNTVILDTTTDDSPSIFLQGNTTGWRISCWGIDSANSHTNSVFNFGLTINNGYTWIGSTASDEGRTLNIDSNGYVVLSPYRTQTSNTGTLPSFLTSVSITFIPAFRKPPTFTFNSFASDGSLTTECVLTSLTTSDASISYTGGLTDNISWTAIGIS
jgi:hypothetical protein